MFRAGSNPYDEIVAKTTDENLTSENWELILNLCDKVQEEGEAGARNVIAAITRRLAHRNPNVQLYSLALAESLTKNCTIDLHREIASRAFTQALEKLITDRTTHEKVRKRCLILIAEWASEFENDPTLGIMEDCYNNLKSKGYKFEGPSEPPPPDVDAEVRRREEEELQRALEISVQDKGGRAAWGQYSLAASSSGAGSSSSHAGGSSSTPGPSSSNNYNMGGASRSTSVEPTYVGGYAPASSASAAISNLRPTSAASPAPSAAVTIPSLMNAPTGQSAPSPVPTASMTGAVVTRVRALYTFEPTEKGELPFDKGDVIKVVDRGYKDWWRGQLKGRTGIFPVNYVEPLPEPTPAELAAEAQQEAAVFMQATNVDRLLQMLRSLDPAKDNLADNEEIQELYRSSMALRPKIVKLIDKYSQKRADLVAMNESFIKARTIFDRMMEESLARHSDYYASEGRPPYVQSQSSYQAGRPESRAYPPGPQAYGWNPQVYEQPGYNAYPAPAGTYGPPGQGQEGVYPQQPYGPPQGPAPGPQPQGPPYGQGGPQPYGYAPPQQQQQQQQQQLPPQQQPEQTPYGSNQQLPNPYGPAPSAQPQLSPQPQAQLQSQPQPQQISPQPQPEPEPSPQPQQGPPFPYDPNTTYEDPNVQAWAQYYAQGGTDPTGAVYFFSVPGVTDHAESPQPQPQPQPQQEQQPQNRIDTSNGGYGGQPQPYQQPQDGQAGYGYGGPISAITPASAGAASYSSPTATIGPGPTSASIYPQPTENAPAPVAAMTSPVNPTPGPGAQHGSQSPLGSGAFAQAIQARQQLAAAGHPPAGGSLIGSASAGPAAAQREDSVSSLPSPGGYPGQGAPPPQGGYYGAGPVQGLQSQFAGMRVGEEGEQPAPGVGA